MTALRSRLSRGGGLAGRAPIRRLVTAVPYAMPVAIWSASSVAQSLGTVIVDRALSARALHLNAVPAALGERFRVPARLACCGARQGRACRGRADSKAAP